MLGVSAWHMPQASNTVEAFRRTAVISLAVLLPAVILALFVGSELGVVEGTYQPMKIAAAEALWNTCDSHCSFSAFQIGGGNNDETPTQIIEIPDLLSILATNHLDGEVQGLNNLNAAVRKGVRARATTSPTSSSSTGPCGSWPTWPPLVFLFALWGGWLLHRKTLDQAKWFLRIAPWVVILPFLINTAGWMLTENGRQPWIVQGLMKTANGGRPRRCRPPTSGSSLIIFVPRIFIGARGGRRLADAPLRPARPGRTTPSPSSVSPGGDAGPSSTDHESSDEDESALVY